jgi:signal transduction histidine kinase/DNA-binding response OmpR family regulator
MTVKSRLLRIALERDTDIVLARRRTRRIVELLGYNQHTQTRITTAVSEIARNAVEHGGGGAIEFYLSSESPASLEIIVSDQGPGIPAAREATEDRGHHGAKPGVGLGIGLRGARRLVRDFSIETGPERGTRITIAEPLPDNPTSIDKRHIAQLAEQLGRALASDAPADPVEEIRQQNREMLFQLQEIEQRRDELLHLNQELQDTNRGVVALYAELDERADHLRRADELKSRFLSNMTHEFRTPLNSILALTRLLLAQTDGVLTQEQQTQVQFIRKSAENLSELVNDLLDLARVEAGKTTASPIEFTADSLFGALRGMLRPLLIGDAVALIFEDCGELPPLVTDEPKVSQILRNFISNALKFTPQGEVRVWAAANPDDDMVTFAVRDTGIGIAPENLELIFEEFGQVPGPIQSRVKGTGLGLPLSKKLAELLGGRIMVESAPGQGSVFSLILPRVLPSATGEAEPDQDIVLDTARLPVLVIEDNPADAFATKRALADSPYQALEARTIAAARRWLEWLTPAAIVLDVVLLGDESWRYLIELKQREKTHAIPVIVVSSTGDKRKAINLGADEYLEKPLDAEQLVAVLRRWTGDGSLIRVLVVDDEPVCRYLVRRLLPVGAFEIVEAATGAEGLAQMRERHPDVVLLDLNMPEMDGFAFLDRLAAAGDLRRPPVVVLTSMALGHDKRSRLTGVSRVLSKAELSAANLIEAIRLATQQTQQTAEDNPRWH